MRADVRPFGFAVLYRAWKACRRGKRGTRKAQRYEVGLLDNLVETAQSLQTRRWRPSRAIRFVVRHPKPREILAADFGDRVVHHVLVPWFERLYEPVFTHDSFANRKGKGTHAAVGRLQALLRRRAPVAAAAAPTVTPVLVRVDRPSSVTSLGSQWRYFRKRYPSHLILMRVGNRLEAWGVDGWNIRTTTRCPGVPVKRPGLCEGLSWPLSLWPRLRARLIKCGMPFVHVDEEGWLRGGMKRRVLRDFFIAAKAAPTAPLTDFHSCHFSTETDR